ncbi:Hypothetical_protein [Hexamita inflata]|uniref:Hypothetical_protein n=1 Tax=Hexamita inflata TaxID=28002 RepID=A0AA86U8W0_9EUKA|nr:Hypothetical protein HINF_LOCUS21423 [Hexamita inflata]
MCVFKAVEFEATAEGRSHLDVNTTRTSSILYISARSAFKFYNCLPKLNTAKLYPQIQQFKTKITYFLKIYLKFIHSRFMPALQIPQIQIIVRFNLIQREKCSVLSHFFDSFVLGTPAADNLERWTSNTSFLLLRFSLNQYNQQAFRICQTKQPLLNKLLQPNKIPEEGFDAILDLKLKQPQIHI